MEENSAQSNWFLEGYFVDDKTLQRWMIRPVPYRVGRNEGMDLCLPFDSVSGQHAELYMKGSTLWVRDLESTNGTFLNRKKIHGDADLQDGDILHFSKHEFRLGRLDINESSGTLYARLSEKDLPYQIIASVREFQQMLLTHSVDPFFQPIVKISGEERIGYEILGRGRQEGLTPLPTELFRIASSLGVEAELSRLFRWRGVQEAKQLEGKPILFLNSHPAELVSPKLLVSLKRLRSEAGSLPMILEIHESGIADLHKMRKLRSQLADLNIGLAYDDFGAGQARLLELVEVPPDYLKFDVTLIRDIHRAPPTRQKMVESLVRMVTETGVPCLAEGVEKKEEQHVCREMGFNLAQGYLFGKPAPLDTWTS